MVDWLPDSSPQACSRRNQNEQNAVNCTYYYHDADGDGYGDQLYTAECWCQPGGSDGYFSVTNQNDCFDLNAEANPSQNGYFGVDRGDGSYDYNCDGNMEQERTTSGSCAGYDLSFSDACRFDTAGWANATPSCGQSGSYIDDDDDCAYNGWLSFSCSESPNGTMLQRCK